MIKDIPVIARMVVVDEIICEKEFKYQEDTSYYNPKYDSQCEYCLNTSSWD